MNGRNPPPGEDLLGVVRGAAIVSVEKGRRSRFSLHPDDARGAREGELVACRAVRGRSGRRRGVRVVRRLRPVGTASDLRHIAATGYGIAFAFPEGVIREAEAAAAAFPPDGPASDGCPYLTVDPVDARDHDDAVQAEPDADPQNPGGHIVRVAIADVARFVRPGSALDREARMRGNSVYFPDAVAHMLPESLSAGLCSLRAGTSKAALVAELQITADGMLVRSRFCRCAIRILRNLTYEDCEAMRTARGKDPVHRGVRALFAAYGALRRARAVRDPLAIELPERTVQFDSAGEVVAVRSAARLESHRLIEEFMLLANRAVAETLNRARVSFLHRCHPPPDPESLRDLARLAGSLGIDANLVQADPGTLKPADFNRLLRRARTAGVEEWAMLGVLRAQQRAGYRASGSGHFGLQLQHYTHFTSPIRRYADLVVHRTLIEACKLGGPGGRIEADRVLQRLVGHLDTCETNATAAERDTVDRCTAAWLEARVGTLMEGYISGSAGMGLFVTLDGGGAVGLVRRFGGGARLIRERDSGVWISRRTGERYAFGKRIRVRVADVSRLSGAIDLVLEEGAGGPDAGRIF